MLPTFSERKEPDKRKLRPDNELLPRQYEPVSESGNLEYNSFLNW